MQGEASIDIAKAPEEVYSYLADFRRHAEWSKGVSEVEQLTEGEIRVGTEFKTVESVPSKFTSFARISELSPPRTIAWESWDDGGMMKVQWSFQLEPVDSGTRVTQRCDFSPQNLMGGLVLNVMRRWQIPGENRASLARVKEIMEGGSPTSG